MKIPSRQWTGTGAWAVAVPPLALVAVLFAFRSVAGPFWLWSNLDPDYFYLFDALHIASGEPPGHVYHPGFTLHALGGLVLRLRHPLLESGALADAVLADPEAYLRLLSAVAIALVGGSLLVLGIAALRATGATLQALTVQVGPFLSSLTLKNEFHFKPEAFLVMAVLMMSALAVLALKPGLLARRRKLFAFGFGVIAGFGIATKVTAAPVFLMPLFLLIAPGAAAVPALGMAALGAVLAFTVFALPAASTIPLFAAWIGKILGASGPHGQGAAGLVNLAQYPGEVLRMLKRPPLHVVLVLTLAALALAGWWHRRGRPVPALEVRILAGTALAQVLLAVVVAKQPWGQYMIPAYVLCGLSLLALIRVALAWGDQGAAAATRRHRVALVAFGAVALLAAGQATVAFKVGHELRTVARNAAAMDDARFAACARVYYYAASAPAFALLLADRAVAQPFDGRPPVTPAFAARLKDRLPARTYLLDDWWTPGRFVLRDAAGPAAPAALLAAPCLVLRGSPPRAQHLPAWLAQNLPTIPFSRACSTVDERIDAFRVGCDGRSAP